MQRNILVIDDEADIRAAISGILEDEGFGVDHAASAEAGLSALQAKLPDLVILDVWLKTGDRDGLDLLLKVRKKWPHLPILMISGHANIEMAVTAMKHGAYDFIEKPFQADRLLLTIARALEAADLRAQNRQLREQVAGVDDLLGTSPQTHNVRASIEKVAPTNARVLLTGPEGAGKEVAARMIHRLSPRAGGPFVTLHCGLVDADRIEGELFGSAHHPGYYMQADHGTLFIDQIDQMPLPVQHKMLRVLQDQKYQHPVTGAWMEGDVRVLSTSAQSIPDLIKTGTFREDLYYRLNVVTVHVPAIADRREDIPAFLTHFMTQCAQSSGRPLRPLTDAALAVLQMYDWPGNVRQLKNVAEWLVIMAPGAATDDIDADDLPPEINHINPSAPGMALSSDVLGKGLREAREQFERAYLQAQIARFGGSVSRAAQFVGMERSALHRKLKLLNVGGADEASVDDEARDVA